MPTPVGGQPRPDPPGLLRMVKEHVNMFRWLGVERTSFPSGPFSGRCGVSMETLCWQMLGDWGHRPGVDHTILLQYPSRKQPPITTTSAASWGPHWQGPQYHPQFWLCPSAVQM